MMEFILLLIEKQESFYDLMKVSPRGFTQTQLKKQYHTLSRIYHPDKSSDLNAADKFILVK
jgi:DnaJ-class molecular chaperone